MDPVIPRYEKFRSIGSGGFSEVYEAWQPDFNRRVAVKVLTLGAGLDIDREAFVRECRAMGTVSEHPNIVTVFDAGLTDGGLPFITMELYHETLLDQIRRSNVVSLRDVLDCGVQICAALQCAHDERMLHRDIKPQNIFFSAYGVPALGDFGIASLADDGQSESQVGFTIHYAAPEVLDGADPSVESDIYSLGASLYSALAGHRPFAIGAGDTEAALISRILTGPPPRITAQQLPTDAERLIVGLLAKHPNDRPRSALEVGELLRDLQSASGFEPTPMRTSAVEVDDRTRPRDTQSNQPLGSRGPSLTPAAVAPGVRRENSETEGERSLSRESAEDRTAATRYRARQADRQTADYEEPAQMRRGLRGAVALVAVALVAVVGYGFSRSSGDTVSEPQPRSPETESTTTTIVIDNSKPGSPTGLETTSVAAGTVQLNWDPVESAVSYRVDYIVGDETSLTTDEVAVELPDSAPGGTRCVVVRSVSAAGRVSDASDEACF